MRARSVPYGFCVLSSRGPQLAGDWSDNQAKSHQSGCRKRAALQQCFNGFHQEQDRCFQTVRRNAKQANLVLDIQQLIATAFCTRFPVV